MSAGDAAGLVKVIKEKVLTNKESFRAKGMNGRRYFEENYQLKDCIDHLEEIINQ